MQMPYYMGGVDPASLSAPVSRGWCCERAKDGGSVPSRVFPSSDLPSPPRPPCLRLGPGAAGRGGKRRRAQRCAPWRKRAGGGGAEGQGETRRSHVCALQVAFALAFLSLQPSLSLQLSLLLCSVSVSLSLPSSLSLSLSLSLRSLFLSAPQPFSISVAFLSSFAKLTNLPPSPLPQSGPDYLFPDSAKKRRSLTERACYATGVSYLAGAPEADSTKPPRRGPQAAPPHPCPAPAVSAPAGSFFGGAYGVFEGLRHPAATSNRLRVNTVLNAVTKRGPFMGNTLGVIGALRRAAGTGSGAWDARAAALPVRATGQAEPGPPQAPPRPLPAVAPALSLTLDLSPFLDSADVPLV